MKYLYKTVISSLSVLSVLLLSHSVSAESTAKAQCKQWQQHAMKSIYAKNKYAKHCAGSANNLAKKNTKPSIKKKMTTGRFYVGASLGQSRLVPRTTVIGAGVDDTSDSSYKLNLGYNINPKFAIEGFYADLGSAGVHTSNGTQGDIDYKLYGISGVYRKPLTNRLKGLVKAGYAKVENSSSQGVNYTQIKDGDWFLGLGLEYAINSRLALKGEYEYFDEDIQLFNIGFNWKF